MVSPYIVVLGPNRRVRNLGRNLQGGVSLILEIREMMNPTVYSRRHRWLPCRYSVRRTLGQYSTPKGLRTQRAVTHWNTNEASVATRESLGFGPPPICTTMPATF